MKTIDNFLQERVRGDPTGKINAPEFAYICLYGKKPSPPIYGRDCAHPQKLYRGIGIDKHIPTRALNDLNKIKEIELRSSCEGESDRHPTFLMFRLFNRDPSYSKKICNNINKFKDGKCCFNIGNEGLPRIVVTTRLWFGKDPKLFNTWWLGLAKKIKTAL